VHDTLRVERDDDGDYVGRCDCGWTTDPAPTGAEIGDQWDVHRRGAGRAGGLPQVQMN
jgi:hypothetical protein